MAPAVWLLLVQAGLLLLPLGHNQPKCLVCASPLDELWPSLDGGDNEAAANDDSRENSHTLEARMTTTTRRTTTPIIDKQTNPLIERATEGHHEGGFLFLAACLRSECNQIEPPSGGRICASDGRLYGSTCELRQHACLTGRQLHRMKSLAHCSRHAANQLAWQPLCTRAQYDRFKAALWRQFHTNTSRLFNFLDANADRRIEARELWPRDHLAPLLSHVDFALAPHFHWSNCSLSHLMIYELSSEGDTFDENSFARAFHELASGQPSVPVTSHMDSTPLHLQLGDSSRLACLSRQLEMELLAVRRRENAHSRPLTCHWSRHSIPLASWRDEHLQLLAASHNHAAALASENRDSEWLQLRDAQLYLSGPVECACRLGPHTFVHTYQLQVTAQPYVLVRPRVQWSLPGSRVAFECQYDIVDTSSPSARTPKVDWLRVGAGSSEPIRSEQQRATISLASSRLELAHLETNDTGQFECRVQLDDEQRWGSSRASLQVGEEPPLARKSGNKQHLLWLFHETGISVFRVDEDEGQRLELARELNGQQPVELDGWNQLTLCGGLTREQPVICEWSDNAIELSVPVASFKREARQDVWQPGDNLDPLESAELTSTRSYVYVAQPNLNRLLVLDGRALTIVAVVHTEPQPRKLFALQPNKIHLNKWVRRRLSPLGNARWLQLAVGGQRDSSGLEAHPLELTPKLSRLHSDKRDGGGGGATNEHELEANEEADGPQLQGQLGRARRQTSHRPRLEQRDIWLLCYGQPLVVDPAHDEAQTTDEVARNQSARRESLARSWPLPRPAQSASAGGGEARLRNRKSIQIIQSTFFDVAGDWRRRQRQLDESASPLPGHQEHASVRSQSAGRQLAAGEFKRATVLTTHYVMQAGGGGSVSAVGESRAPIDLVQDLSVPVRPRWLAAAAPNATSRMKVHFAYALHYAERQLYRIAVDSYHYDRHIELENCEPLVLLATLQGQLVIQCRAPITHQPLGQLVLDELTGARLQFNANVRAQAHYLTPDSRYLISVATNQTAAAPQATRTILYVQLVHSTGLELQYEIKTALEIVQCAFVWKEGYYAATFVALNRRERQTELLSLRLADSRLELMIRVAGLANELRARHREPLVLLEELKMASLTTSEATHIVDLDENRIIQTLGQVHGHSSSPTLLWT